MKVYMEEAKQVLGRLKVDEERGLNLKQVEENRKQYGQNIFSKEKSKSFFRKIVDAASEPMIIMLIIAAIIALGVNGLRYVSGGETEFIECIGIFVAISLAVIITVIMEGRSEKAFEALGKIEEDLKVKVLREGSIQLISQKEVTIADIICVETGDRIVADGRLISSISLRMDESSLTGESLTIKKEAESIMIDEKVPVAERTNMLYAGSFVTEGNGKMVVTGIGNQTEFGKIAKELAATDQSTTPLQEKLAHLGKVITLLGTSMAAIVFIIQVVIFVSQGIASLDTISEAFITSIVLIVAAVPEGLPTIVAVSLAINIIKMSKQNALVKKMIACETVGCINVICSDKTGTLTENRMTVTHIYADGKMIKPAKLVSENIIQNFCVNSTAHIEWHDKEPKFIGNPTECALIVACDKAGIDYNRMRKDIRTIYTYPFSSETKNMTTIIAHQASYVAYTKGSPEKIMSMCSMTPDAKRKIEETILTYQKKACRIIALAHKRINQEVDFEADREMIEEDMIYDGFVVITDPLRKEVYEAVKRCRHAGIDLKILTGDNIVTATAIAEELHLLTEGYIAIEARELEELSDEELAKKLPRIRVIARSTPIVKMRIVNVLKALGEVVAVTGDGINDAPAIKNADVGVAMGISGTEVSKEASDIVLLDDSFSTIVQAVQWGRGIYENFQRFIQFQLTVNLSSVIVVLMSILLGFKAPFTALQLLWINIIMDGPPALTLGLEPIRENLMTRKPTPRDASIVTKGMLSRIVFNGLFISAVFMLQTSQNILGGKSEEGSTILFTLFVVLQLFNAFNSRELSDVSIFKNFANNKLMLLVFGITFLLQVMITQWGGAVFNTVALPLGIWLKIIGVAFTVILASEGLKWIKRNVHRTKSSHQSYE